MSIPILPADGTPDDGAPAPLRDVRHSMRPGVLSLGSLPPLSLYVHLPWCLKKCPYCDFNSHEAQGGRGALPEQRYLDALMADLESALPLIWGRTVHSVFIGGGTPRPFFPAGDHQPIGGGCVRPWLCAGVRKTLEG